LSGLKIYSSKYQKLRKPWKVYIILPHIIFNTSGQCIYQNLLEVYPGGYATKGVDISWFVNGVYIISIKTSKELLFGKFVKE
jgi:hypothetical protein